MAQLVEWSLMIPEVCSSNPIQQLKFISLIFFSQLYSKCGREFKRNQFEHQKAIRPFVKSGLLRILSALITKEFDCGFKLFKVILAPTFKVTRSNVMNKVLE